MSVEFIAKNWMLFLALAVLLALLVADTLRRTMSGVRKVSAVQLPTLTRDDAVIVDVSEPHEYKKGHIPQAVNMPMKELMTDHSRLNKHKKKPVSLVFRAGNRSDAVGRHLIKQGFENVYGLAGGMVAWEKENLPLERA